jgi:hypothetical protein
MKRKEGNEEKREKKGRGNWEKYTDSKRKERKMRK